jgi:hypothetical protein
VDTNIPPQENDTQLVTYLKQMQRPFLVVGTKADKLSNNQLGKSVAALKKAHEVGGDSAGFGEDGCGDEGAVGEADGSSGVMAR